MQLFLQLIHKTICYLSVLLLPTLSFDIHILTNHIKVVIRFLHTFLSNLLPYTDISCCSLSLHSNQITSINLIKSYRCHISLNTHLTVYFNWLQVHIKRECLGYIFLHSRNKHLGYILKIMHVQSFKEAKCIPLLWRTLCHNSIRLQIFINVLFSSHRYMLPQC